jgi:Flp pilus assembly protein TadD
MARTLKTNTRLLPALAICLLGCTALSGSAQAGWFDSGTDKKDTAAPRTEKADTAKPAPATDLDGSIRQAQLLRVSGDYAGAIQHLSQLMLVAADDGRVVTEYGKTLAAMGRAQEAMNFLTRAEQLQGNDWTVYNAMGVADDQLGKQDDARIAYERALTLKPGEAAVLNNYALSRMLAKDPDGAKALIARAQSAGGASDPKIARNIALIDKLTPAAEAPKAVAMAQPLAAPRLPVSAAPMPLPPRVAQAAPQVAPQTAPQISMAQPAPFVNAAPRILQPAASGGMIQAQPQMMAQSQPSGVVMQRVPVDPQAGPVIHLHMPAPKPAKVAKADAPKPQAVSAADDLQAKADAIAKTLNGKPAAIAQAKAEASKPDAPKAAASSKPVAVAKVEMPKPASPTAVPVKAVVKKDAIPSLRMSANAY